jgi:histidine phosphotransfer protein HptB
MTIDLATFRELQDTAGADFVVELVDTFLQEAPPMLAELRAALDTQSLDRFRRTAHSLKSNAMTFGASELAALARDLETGGLPADAAPVDRLQAEYDRAAAALKELAYG